MNLYLISQRVNNDYDTYDSAVVCAKNKKEAQNIHPSGFKCNLTWCSSENVLVELIGQSKKGLKKGVIVASFNAG